jgi:hypothetical protein
MNVGSGTEMTLEELVLVPRRLHEAEITATGSACRAAVQKE